MKGINPKIVFGGLILVAVGFCFTKLPLTSFLFVAGVAIVLYGFTKSLLVVLVTFLIPILLQIFNSSMGIKSSKPVAATSSSLSVSVPDRLKNIKIEANEGFQARDPVSIHTRIEDVKQAAPKKKEPTGVLQSPEILDNTPLVIEGMDGEPGMSTPASINSRNMIYPPSEESIPSMNGSRDMPPMANPVLQNGQDPMSVGVALSRSATGLPPVDVEPSNMARMQRTDTMGSAMSMD